MKHEYTEHEEKRNNGANSPFQLGEADRKHIAGIGVDVPCAKRGQKEQWRNIKSGVPDICLPVANNGFHGLYIELKFGKNKATKAQEEYMAMLNAQGYKTAVCYGAEKAGEEILAYLTEPGRMPKKACVNAPWINGKCDGINLPSRMFSREECRGCKNFNPGREERIINEILSEHPEKREIKQAIINLSCGQTGNKKIESMEDTLEIINVTLGGMVKGNELTVEQSAAVLTVAMKAYEVGKKARIKA